MADEITRCTLCLQSIIKASDRFKIQGKANLQCHLDSLPFPVKNTSSHICRQCCAKITKRASLEQQLVSLDDILRKLHYSGYDEDSSGSETAGIPRLLRFLIWSCIRDVSGEKTIMTLVPRSLSNNTSATIGRHWKINDLPKRVGIFILEKIPNAVRLFRIKILDLKLGFYRFKCGRPQTTRESRHL